MIVSLYCPGLTFAPILSKIKFGLSLKLPKNLKSLIFNYKYLEEIEVYRI